MLTQLDHRVTHDLSLVAVPNGASRLHAALHVDGSAHRFAAWRVEI